MTATINAAVRSMIYLIAQESHHHMPTQPLSIPAKPSNEDTTRDAYNTSPKKYFRGNPHIDNEDTRKLRKHVVDEMRIVAPQRDHVICAV